MHPDAFLSALTLVALLLLSAGAGCTADPAGDTAPPTVMASTAVTAPEALASFVPPAPNGWRLLAPPSSATLEEDGAPLISATASYLPDSDPNGTGNRTADLTIQDTGGRSIGLRKLVDLLPGAPGDATGLVRTTLRGEPAAVVRDDQMTRAYLVVADRYVVYLAVAGATPADFETFITALDLEGLSRRR